MFTFLAFVVGGVSILGWYFATIPEVEALYLLSAGISFGLAAIADAIKEKK